MSIHGSVSTLSPGKAAASVIFHSLTGCNSASFFFDVCKKTHWEAWMSDPEFTQMFFRVLTPPEKFQYDFSRIRGFISLMYDKTIVYNKVNDARKHLFTKKGRMLESIPPTQAVFTEHTKEQSYRYSSGRKLSFSSQRFQIEFIRLFGHHFQMRTRIRSAMS